MALFRQSKKDSETKRPFYPGEHLDIEGILALDDPADSIEEVNNELKNKIRRLGFDHLSQQEKVLHHVILIELEVEKGGFNAYFFNSSGNYAQDTPEAFDAIGAHQAAKIVRQAISLFPGGGPPRDQATRDALFDLVSDDIAARWRECDQMFRDNMEPIGDMLIEYMKSNRNKIVVGG
jgi:hypothetical protein